MVGFVFHPVAVNIAATLCALFLAVVTWFGFFVNSVDDERYPLFLLPIQTLFVLLVFAVVLIGIWL